MRLFGRTVATQAELWLLRVQLLTAVAALLAAGVFLSPVGAAPVAVVVVGAGSSVVILGLFVARAAARRRARTVLRDHGYRLCPHCGYDLSGLESGSCPECGRVYSKEAVVSAWKSLYSPPTGDLASLSAEPWPTAPNTPGARATPELRTPPAAPRSPARGSTS